MTEAVAFIRRNSDGEVREYLVDFDPDDPDDEFLWADGLCACDCNRASLFGEAAPQPCGVTAYSVRIEIDGTAVYDDWEEGTAT